MRRIILAALITSFAIQRRYGAVLRKHGVEQGR